MVRTTDNNKGIKISNEIVSDFRGISNKKINSLISENNSNLLIFPDDLNQTEDKIGNEIIFSIQNNILTTGNIMGFIGCNGSEITIQSRFDKCDKNYFLHYMLQKVFSINMFNLKHGINNEAIFDFLIYLFPYYLKKALRQGLYKEYHKQEYNDSNVKGSIDFNKHIRSNLPFVGNIAYRVREHSYENKISHLIRHTIEYIKKHKFAQGILKLDLETQNCINEIIQVTPRYDYRDRLSIINKNLKPFSHPFFFEYKELKKICMQILRYEGLKYGNEKDKIYGLLFDGAWLWEEYLNTILKHQAFKHPQNKCNADPIYLFKDSGYKQYPDFWKENIVLDAKYKNLSKKIERDDMHQIITYMHVKVASYGAFLFPSEKTVDKHIGRLNGFGGDLYTLSIGIPRNSSNFYEFTSIMALNENKFKEIVNRISNTGCST